MREAQRRAVSAVILAAGEGRRLRPVTEHTPKALLPAFGTPLLDIAAAQAVRAGVQRIAVNACHLGAAIEERVLGVLARRYSKVNWMVSREGTLLGTGGGVARLAGWLGEDPFWVVNADSLFVAELGALEDAWRDARADAAMLVSDRKDHGVATNLRLNAAGYVEGLGKKGGARGVAYWGVLLAGRGLVDVLARAPAPACLVRQGIVPWVEQGARVLGWDGGVWFADTGTPERYLRAHRDGLAHVREFRRLGVFAP